jgi:hypothetical protein
MSIKFVKKNLFFNKNCGIFIKKPYFTLKTGNLTKIVRLKNKYQTKRIPPRSPCLREKKILEKCLI